MMYNVCVFEHLVHRSVNDKLVIVMINRGADHIRLRIIRQSEFPENLPGKLCPFVRVIVIRSRSIGMEIMHHSCHCGELRILPALLRDHCCGQRHTVKMINGPCALVGILHLIEFIVNNCSDFL